MRNRIQWFAFGWAAAVYVILLRAPMYAGVRTAVGARTSLANETGTLASVNGPRVYFILAVPIVAALLVLIPWPSALRRAAGIIAAVIATAFVLLGLMTVGVFFAPTAAALVGLAVIAEKTPRAAA